MALRSDVVEAAGVRSCFRAPPILGLQDTRPITNTTRVGRLQDTLSTLPIVAACAELHDRRVSIFPLAAVVVVVRVDVCLTSRARDGPPRGSMSKRERSAEVEQRLINLRKTMADDAPPPPPPSDPPPPPPPSDPPPPPPPSDPPPPLPLHQQQLRFVLKERVVCKISRGEWLTGEVAMLNEPDPHEPGSLLPYIVSLDKTDRMISAPHDKDECVRMEVCFTEAEWQVSRSISAGRSSLALRFKVGDDVACLRALGRDGSSAEWSRARVRQVWPSLDPREPRTSSRYPLECVPYLLELLDEDGEQGRPGGEGGFYEGVLCHRDDHCLVRDLALQPLGPRADRSRFVTRRRADGGGYEELDHQTRVVRSMQMEREASRSPTGGRPQPDTVDDGPLCGVCEE